MGLTVTVVRALGRERWTEELAPAQGFNPPGLLEARERRQRRQHRDRPGPRRVRARRRERPPGGAP